MRPRLRSGWKDARQALSDTIHILSRKVSVRGVHRPHFHSYAKGSPTLGSLSCCEAVNSLQPVSLQNLLHSSAAPKTLLLSWEISSRLLSGTSSNKFACIRIIRCMTFNICTVFFFSLKNSYDISGCKTVQNQTAFYSLMAVFRTAFVLQRWCLLSQFLSPLTRFYELPSEWASPHIVLLQPVSSSHWGIAGNSLLMSGLWPLAPTLTALDLSISPHCLWSSWGLSTLWPLTPWWPVGTSTTGLRPASSPLRTLTKQPIFKPLRKDVETVWWFFSTYIP